MKTTRSQPRRSRDSNATPRVRTSAQSTPHWYACYTRARHEKKVHELLTRRGFESFLPLVSRKRRWHDRVATVRMPLFPSYVFARFRLARLAELLSMPGVATIVQFGGRPLPVAEEEIESVRALASALRDDDHVEAVRIDGVQEGTPVRIDSGAFAGVKGVVLERRGGEVLLQVGLEAVGHAVRVRVNVGSVEAL